jgi:hypothetical protein
MILDAFTLFHVAFSLIGITSGVAVTAGLLAAKTFSRWTTTFLVTTAATSVTGFLFPFQGVTPAQVLGMLSLIVLLVASLAIYRRHLQGIWHRMWVISAVTALYFNVFVLVVQLFRRVPALKAIVPTQSEPPFQIVQLAVLLLFTAIAIRAASRKPASGNLP